MKITISVVDDSANNLIVYIIICVIIKFSFVPCLDSFRKIRRWDECHEFEVQLLFVELVLCGFHETFEGQL